VVLTLANKKSMIEELATVAKTAQSLVVVDYSGLTAEEVTLLRKQARAADVYLKVMKNTLVKRALQESAFNCAVPAMAGPALLAFSMRETGKAAKLIDNFIRVANKLEVKTIVVGGELLNAKSLQKVAALPTYQEAIAELLGVLQAPLGNFARVLAEPQVKIARILDAVSKQQSVNS